MLIATFSFCSPGDDPNFGPLLSSVMDEFVGQTMLGVHDAPFSL